MNSIHHRGFTLVELMVVVVIIAIFAVIAIPSYQFAMARIYRSKAQTEMLKISERLENFKGKQLTYAGYVPENQNSGEKGVINLPYGSSNTDYEYKITLMDINYTYASTDTAKANPATVPLEDSILGQGWKMVAIPNQNKSNALRQSEYLLMNSQGLKCMTQDSLTITSNTCTNSRDW